MLLCYFSMRVMSILVISYFTHVVQDCYQFCSATFLLYFRCIFCRLSSKSYKPLTFTKGRQSKSYLVGELCSSVRSVMVRHFPRWTKYSDGEVVFLQAMAWSNCNNITCFHAKQDLVLFKLHLFFEYVFPTKHDLEIA